MKRIGITLVTVLALVAAACGDDSDTGGTTAPQATTAAPAATTAAPTATEAPASEFAGTIKIGAAVSETGKYAREGKDVRQGYSTWEKWVNDEYGGIQVGADRYLVEVVYYDDESDADTAALLTEKLITEDDVSFLLGPYSSGITKGTSAIAEKYGMIMVEGNGASESLFERDFENLFGVLTPASLYTKSALEAVAGEGAKSVVIAYEDTSFPTSVAEGAIKWVEELGMDLLAVETYPKDVADISAIMTTFRDLEPDVFVGGGHFNDALLFVNAAEELDFNPDAMIITVGPSNSEFAQEVGTLADYVIGPTQWEATMGWEDEYFGTAGDFAARYEGEWSEPPSYQAAESTAAALVLQLAIQEAGSLDQDAVRTALQNLDVTTFYGPIRFDDTGKNVAKPMGAIQIQDGQTHVVAPSAAAVTDLLYPLMPWGDR
ncbi:MAG: amino acid ABC transporter substrate-binding protein [Acidimicrobiia bacterium]